MLSRDCVRQTTEMRSKSLCTADPRGRTEVPVGFGLRPAHVASNLLQPVDSYVLVRERVRHSPEPLSKPRRTSRSEPSARHHGERLNLGFVLRTRWATSTMSPWGHLEIECRTAHRMRCSSAASILTVLPYSLTGSVRVHFRESSLSGDRMSALSGREGDATQPAGLLAVSMECLASYAACASL